jgi:hypothetical protein
MPRSAWKNSASIATPSPPNSPSTRPSSRPKSILQDIARNPDTAAARLIAENRWCPWQWELLKPFTAGPIQWPTPEIHMMGPLTTYGYAGDAYLLTTITPPKETISGPLEIKAHADWLVCREECIPGKADLGLYLKSGQPTSTDPARKKFFAEAKARLPVPNTRWDIKAAYGKGGGTIDNQHDALWIMFSTKAGQGTQPLGKIYFFPEQGNVLSANETDNGMPQPDEEFSGRGVCSAG